MTGPAETRYCRFRPLAEKRSHCYGLHFAIGCLLYEIITGKQPYADLDSEEVKTRCKFRNFLQPMTLNYTGMRLPSENPGMIAIGPLPIGRRSTTACKENL